MTTFYKWSCPRIIGFNQNTGKLDCDQTPSREELNPLQRCGLGPKKVVFRNKAGDYETFRDFYFREIEANYDPKQENFGE